MFKDKQTMLNNIKTKFSIKDLENFTGIKQHTIRIWEKRYNLLEPSRSDTNIRYYDTDNFLKLLNISLLYNNGLKISKIAEFSEEELLLKTKELTTDKALDDAILNEFKIAMLNFDVAIFNQAYNKLLAYKPFSSIFLEVFVPLLSHIGYLWQNKSIKPVHEHFISNLITQKIHMNIERNQALHATETDKTFVLFLPMNEIHELGLLYFHYELTLRGYHSIYLGQNIAIDSIEDIITMYDNIQFVSYFTVEPNESTVNDYLEEIQSILLNGTEHSFWFLGRRAIHFKDNKNHPNIRAFSSLESALQKI